MQGWHLHDFWPRFCRGKSCHFVCFVVVACCLCDISCLLAGDLQNGEQCPGSPVYTYAPPRAPLSRISRELLLNCSWTCHELFVNYPWQFVTVVALHALSSTGMHRPDVFTNSLCIVYNPVAKFCRDENFEHLKIFVLTWHTVTTGLRTLHASLRLVCALARLELCQRVPQNRASVSLAIHVYMNHALVMGGLNSSQHHSEFQQPLIRRTFENMGEKRRKCWKLAFFSFSHNVFYPSTTNFNFLAAIVLSPASALILDQSKILLFGKELTHYKLTNIRLFGTERVCRRKFQIWWKWKKVIQTGRKHCGKGEIAHYEQFLLFPQCFQKACFPGASKGVTEWEWVNASQSSPVYDPQNPFFV